MSSTDETAAAQLARAAIRHEATSGIPAWMIHIMEHAHIERIAGVAPGDYRRHPEEVYLACQRNIGVCMIDQFIPDNPLTMGDCGYEGTERGATTGADRVVLDGITIDSPEAVVEHMERVLFPRLKKAAAEFDEDRRVLEIIEGEADIQSRLGSDILKSGFGFVHFPTFAYGDYGYANYFMAYALYPDVIERGFKLKADSDEVFNRIAARASSSDTPATSNRIRPGRTTAAQYSTAPLPPPMRVSAGRLVTG